MKKSLFFILFIICCVSPKNISAQETKRKVFVKYITEKITLDGVLDEPIWQIANKADGFNQYFPTDSLKAKNLTEVRLLYSETHIYVGIKAKSVAGKFVVNSLRRDFVGTASDNVSVVFDTFSDGTNAFMFGANPYGVQREVFISSGGAVREGFNHNWDIKWLAEGKMEGDYYTLEFAIPFNSLKFKGGSQKWGFQTYRFDLQTNEQSAWSRVAQNQLLANLGYMGELQFERPLKKNHTPIYLIPYINVISSTDYKTDKTVNKVSIGGDAKIAIGNGLNLDITANPDFSNVEVDNIVTNTTRFELSFPEKRQFFIDNGDLFAGFGNYFNEAKPFFSRRIGIVKDTAGNNVENKIIGGLRLSGKLNDNWRLGFLNLQTADDPINEIVSNNNSMFALQRKLFSRSNIGVFMVNRQTTSNYNFQDAANKYNRVAGIDYNLASKDSKWNGRFYLHKSFQPEDNKGNLSSQAIVVYNTRKYNIITDLVYVDKDFRADLGFVPRKDIFKTGNGFFRSFYPKSGIVNKHTPNVVNILFFSPNLEMKKTEQMLWGGYDIEFKNQAILNFKYTYQYIYLSDAFDPTDSSDAIPLPANSDYKFKQFNVVFTSKNSSAFTYLVNATAGEFYNGSIASINATANLRMMPKALISININYNKINLPKPYPQADILLISPKLDFTFSKSLFWSSLIQYSNRQNNLGINSRLQWRFAPLSDLFLVYNDNYYTREFSPTYRSINLKLAYWF